MPDITDPEAIKFVNDYIRPMCETLRYMTVRGVDWSAKWEEVATKFPNDTSLVEDGRSEEGISRLTSADIHNVSTVFISLLTMMDASSQTAIAKPCVRPLLYSNMPS